MRLCLAGVVALRGDVDLELTIPDDLWPIFGDAAEFEIALIHLAVNARDAMPKGGFRVTATNEQSADEASVLLTISDTGEGIAADFFRAAGRGGPTAAYPAGRRQ